MKILHIASKLPWPLIDGARICMFRGIEGLAALGHEIHTIAFDETFSDPGDLVRFSEVTVVPLRIHSAPVGAALTVLRRRPYTQLKRESSRAYHLLEALCRRERFDVVLVDEIHVASYGDHLKHLLRIPYVLRTHNIECEIYRRHTATVRNPITRAYLELQTTRWRRFEVEQFAAADVVIAITERDREAVMTMAPGRPVHTIPAAVDLDAFAFRAPEERDSRSMVMLGDMRWPPNRDAALWFANEILPMVLRSVPDAVLHLIGGNPPVDRLPPASERFRIEGRVADVRPFFEEAAVGLIPLRVGGGMRVKMIEMMSAGMPVVSTGQGAEGNEAIPDRHYLRADTTEDFARQVIRLLMDRETRSELAGNARTFAEERFSVDVVARAMEASLQEAVDLHSSRPKEVTG